MEQVVLFKVGDSKFAIRTKNLIEVIKLNSISVSKVPNVPAYILGNGLTRNGILPLVGLAELYDLKDSTPDLVLIMENGLVVDEVVNCVDVDQLIEHEVSPMLKKERSTLCKILVYKGTDMYQELDYESLMQLISEGI